MPFQELRDPKTGRSRVRPGRCELRDLPGGAQVHDPLGPADVADPLWLQTVAEAGRHDRGRPGRALRRLVAARTRGGCLGTEGPMPRLRNSLNWLDVSNTIDANKGRVPRRRSRGVPAAGRASPALAPPWRARPERPYGARADRPGR